MRHIISADWGTSRLRLRLLDVKRETVIDEVEGNDGIASVFKAWEQSGKKESERIAFYQSVLEDAITRLREKSKTELEETNIVLSGMASSNIGMHPLPYKDLPFKTDGSNLITQTLPKCPDFPHAILLISGVKTDTDVMRGEETQLVGCSMQEKKRKEAPPELYLFPGTHSKHVIVQNKQAVAFKTYMTGELFALLSQQSILAGSVKEPGAHLKENIHFGKGVRDSQAENLLSAAFRIRVNYLFERSQPEENYDYLSGLVIGSELKDLAGYSQPIFVVANEDQRTRYMLALSVIGRKNVTNVDSAAAVTRGHCRICRLHNFHLF